MNWNTRTFATLAAALLVGNAVGAGCGGRLTTDSTDIGGAAGVSGSGGAGGSGATGAMGGSGGVGGSTGGAGAVAGSGGTTIGTGGATGGVGGAGGATGGVGGTGGATGGRGGTGGATGGTGGFGGATGGRGGTGGVSIQCGTRTCSSIPSPLGTLLPCCPAGESNACGAQVPFGTGTCVTTTPGVPNARCPSLQVAGVSLAGCCRPNGLCGVDASVAGLGCADPAALGGAPAQRCP